jgi:hypothetical protein
MEGMHAAAKRRCPYCGCHQLAHSRLGGVIEEQFLTTLRLDAYRCCVCRMCVPGLRAGDRHTSGVLLELQRGRSAHHTR